MTASATDIITYIGVPLAVIGVLPIITVVLKTLLFSFRVRSDLRKNLDVLGLYQTPIWPFQSPRESTKLGGDSTLIPGKHYFQALSYYSIDVDVLVGQITISYPVLLLSPPPNGHRLYRSMRPPAERDHSYRSMLKGGTWSILYFLVEVVPENSSRPEIEMRNYVLKPTSRVCQRPALIRFASLVNYLMDLGAFPDPMGWKHLFSEELRISQGTVLVRTRQPMNRNAGETAALPILVVRKQEEEEDDRLLAMLLSWQGVTDMISETKSGNGHPDDTTVTISHVLQPQHELGEVPADQRGTLKLEISRDGISRARLERQGNRSQASINVAHIAIDPWFSSLAFVIGTHQNASRTYFVPVATVLCSWLGSQDAAAIAFEKDAHGMISRDNFQGPTVGGIPYAITEKVKKNRISHALEAHKWTVRTIARNMRQYLVEHYLVPTAPVDDEDGIAATVWHINIAERIMYRLILNPDEADEVREILNRWQSRWYDNGLGRKDVEWIAGHANAFVLATYLLYALGDYAVLHHAREDDPYELVAKCLAKWKEVLIY